MNSSSRYAINAPDIVSENFSGQIVMLNLANGHYFNLSGIAAPIWGLLVAGHTPLAIVDSVRAARPELAEPSTRFLERLLELKLIRAAADEGSSPPAPIDEGWSGEAPDIQVYDDLAELIFSDPIHDVDEQAGWPTLRQTP